MLFDTFNITLLYRKAQCELEIREAYTSNGTRNFEVIQGGIGILMLMFQRGEWTVYIVDDLHPVVKQDTEQFVSEELIELLTQAIKTYFDCLSERKLV